MYWLEIHKYAVKLIFKKQITNNTNSREWSPPVRAVQEVREHPPPELQKVADGLVILLHAACTGVPFVTTLKKYTYCCVKGKYLILTFGREKIVFVWLPNKPCDIYTVIYEAPSPVLNKCQPS